MHDRLVSRRIDALHQCVLVFICNSVVSVRRGFLFLYRLRCFIVTLPGPFIKLFLTSDLEIWYILQSVQRKTNALILLSGYGALLRICYFIFIFFVLFVCLI